LQRRRIGGWGVSTTFATHAAAIEYHYEISVKASLVGSYAVAGTDVDGTSYTGSHKLDTRWRHPAPSNWIGTTVSRFGVGQVIGDVLAVACLSKGRTVILTMNINPDGSLSDKWSRRTDRGSQGTETWTKS
jgi:hypothetical protein